jgi:hypothetical protein
MEVGDDPRSATGTETLADGDLLPPGFNNASRARMEGLPIEIFDNRRYLKVECSATQKIVDTREKCPGRRHYRGN